MWKLSQNDGGWYHNIFKSDFGLGFALKDQSWDLKTVFSSFQQLIIGPGNPESVVPQAITVPQGP